MFAELTRRSRRVAVANSFSAAASRGQPLSYGSHIDRLLVKRERTEEEALLAIAQIQKTRLVSLSDSLALVAADVSLEFCLAMADSIVYATARAENAELVTSDKDLQGLPGVTYVPKVGKGS